MRILIADDEPISRRMLESALRRMGHDVLIACDGQIAWTQLRRHDIRLVIADWMMPKMDGLELVRRIRTLENHRYIYTILLTSRGMKQDIVDGLAAGADDYVTKPFDPDELMVRIRAGERVVRLEEELARRNEQLRRLTLIDPLTETGNRRAFDDAVRQLYDHSSRHNRNFGLLMIDIDRFKSYNDSYGHSAGDDTLREVARLIRENMRSADLAFRFGGEEFTCILPETDINGAFVVADRLRAAIQDAAISHPENSPFGVVTISCGVATNESAADGPVTMVELADTALYRAKDGGRNRVVADCATMCVPA